jgi:hypothetical protein
MQNVRKIVIIMRIKLTFDRTILARLMHANIVEQMKLLDLMFDSPGEVLHANNDMRVPANQIRMKQRFVVSE